MSESFDLRCLCFYLTVVVILMLLSGRVDAVVSQEPQTTPLPCGSIVCQHDGDGSRQGKAIRDAFAVSQPIDLVFIVCATDDCITKEYNRIKSVIEFIVMLMDFLATSYEVEVDPESIHVAIVTYNHSTAWLFFDGISSEAKKIDSVQFRSISRSLETLPWNSSQPAENCKLAAALELATTTLSRSVRKNAKRIVWTFSDCKFCERSNGIDVASEKEKANSLEVKNQARTLKSYCVTVFTVGVGPCPQGFFDTLDKEKLLGAVASSKESHFACIDSWITFAFFSSPDMINVSTYADPGEGIDSKCVCHVVGNAFSCEGVGPYTLIIVGAGVGGAVLLIVVVVIIIVVCIRRGRCCCHGHKNGPPPSVPRRNPPPVPPRPPNSTESPEPDVVGGYVNARGEMSTDNAIGEIDYEIMECERNMDGWRLHLVTVKRQFEILDLGIYAVDSDDYFAQTPGFAISNPEKKRIHRLMANHHDHSRRLPGRSRMVSVVTVASTEFTVDSRALSNSTLSAKSSDKVLIATCKDGYISIGVSRLNRGTACQSAVKSVLDDVTRQ